MIDFLFDNDTSINGIGTSDLRHQHDIIELHKGDNKFSPHIGVGIRDHVDDETATGELENIIQRNYKRDGLTTTKLNVSKDGNIDIDANY